MKEPTALSVFSGTQGMSSLDIAEITGKAHKNVMRDIRNLLERGLQQLNFEPMQKEVPTNNGGHKTIPCYSLTPKGCLILASGYDAKLREKIINRLEALEKHGTPSYQIEDPITRAQRWIEEQQEKKALEAKNHIQAQALKRKDTEIVELSDMITEMQPKVSYLDTILQCKDTVTITQIAQDYGLSAKAFNKILEGYRVQRRVNGVWIVYAPYLKEGYVVSRTKQGKYPHSDGTPFFYQQTEWTYKGRAFLYEQLKKKGIVPTIEKQA